MPDGDQIQAGDAQTSQQVKGTAIQPGDDFILDFGDGDEGGSNFESKTEQKQEDVNLPNGVDDEQSGSVTVENNYAEEQKEGIGNLDQEPSVNPVIDNEKHENYADFDMSLGGDGVVEDMNIDEQANMEKSVDNNADEQHANVVDDTVENEDTVEKVENSEEEYHVEDQEIDQKESVNTDILDVNSSVEQDDLRSSNDMLVEEMKIIKEDDNHFDGNSELDADNITENNKEAVVNDATVEQTIASEEEPNLSNDYNIIAESVNEENSNLDMNIDEQHLDETLGGTDDGIMDSTENKIGGGGELGDFQDATVNNATEAKYDLSEGGFEEDSTNVVENENSVVDYEDKTDSNNLYGDKGEGEVDLLNGKGKDDLLVENVGVSSEDEEDGVDAGNDFVLDLAGAPSESLQTEEIVGDVVSEGLDENPDNSGETETENNGFLLDTPEENDSTFKAPMDDNELLENNNMLSEGDGLEGPEQKESLVYGNELDMGEDIVEDVSDGLDNVSEENSSFQADSNMEDVAQDTMGQQELEEVPAAETTEINTTNSVVPQENDEQVESSQTVTNNEIVDNVVLGVDEQNPEDLAASIGTWSPNDSDETKTSSVENLNIVKQPETTEVQSTLSLDQILDTELLSNPNLKDNSTAVPVNTVNPSGFFSNKKAIGVIAGVGIFLLVSFVFALAFPFGNNNREPNEVVEAGTEFTYIPEPEISGEHGSAEEPEVGPVGLENPVNLTGSSPSGDHGTTSGVYFPEVMETTEEPLVDIEPYIYVAEEMLTTQTEEELPLVEEVSIDKIRSDIFSFKSQAEIYYSAGQDTSDKQLMKYATQMKYLCENYQSKLDEGEGADYESYSAFKTDINGIISKINKYMGGGDELVVIQNLEDDSYFEGKEELLNYVKNR